MKIGNRVRVNSKQEYNGNFYKKSGTLIRKSGSGDDTLWGVRLDGYHNRSSQYDVFWFPQRHLQRLIHEPDVDVETITESEVYLMSDYKTVLVKFNNGTNHDTTYAYACYDEVKNGDNVVVKTGHHGFSLAQIADAEPTNPGKVLHGREVVCIVDFSNFEARKAKAQRAAELKSQMDEKVQQLQNVHLYEMMAARDPALAALLAEYKELNGIKDITTAADTDGSENK